MQLTIDQCFNAVAALTTLGRAPLPLRLAIRVARLRFAVQSVIDPVVEARQATMRGLAEHDADGEPVIERLPNGLLTFKLLPSVQYQEQRDYDAALKELATIDAAPLTTADLPPTFAIEPDVVFGLGPLFVD